MSRKGVDKKFARLSLEWNLTREFDQGSCDVGLEWSTNPSVLSRNIWHLVEWRTQFFRLEFLAPFSPYISNNCSLMSTVRKLEWTKRGKGVRAY